MVGAPSDGCTVVQDLADCIDLLVISCLSYTRCLSQGNCVAQIPEVREELIDPDPVNVELRPRRRHTCKLNLKY